MHFSLNRKVLGKFISVLLQERPKIFLTLEELARENTANFRTDLKDEDMPPLFISDIQSLILFAVQGSACKVKPRYDLLKTQLNEIDIRK